MLWKGRHVPVIQMEMLPSFFLDASKLCLKLRTHKRFHYALQPQEPYLHLVLIVSDLDQSTTCDYGGSMKTYF